MIRWMLAKPWWQTVMAMNLLFVVTTLPASRLLSPLNLAGENNAATWWSGAILFLASLHGWQCGRERSGLQRWCWYLLALFFLGLAASEIGSLHERIKWRFPQWKLIVAPFALVIVAATLSLLRTSRSRRPAIALLVGLLLLCLVQWQEEIEISREWTGWIQGVRAGAEEGTELLASSCFLLATVLGSGLTVQSSLGHVLAIGGLPLRGPVLLTGLLISTVLVTAATPYLDDLVVRGNPAACFPAWVYGALAFTRLAAYAQASRGTGWIAGVLFLFFSVDAVSLFLWKALVYFPGSPDRYSLDVFRAYFVWAFILHALLMVGWMLWVRRFLATVPLLLTAGLCLFAIQTPCPWLHLVAPTTVALAAAGVIQKTVR